MDELTDTDREILDFERQWWKYAGAKETAIRERFGMSATRYYPAARVDHRPARCARGGCDGRAAVAEGAGREATRTFSEAHG